MKESSLNIHTHKGALMVKTLRLPGHGDWGGCVCFFPCLEIQTALQILLHSHTSLRISWFGSTFDGENSWTSFRIRSRKTQERKINWKLFCGSVLLHNYRMDKNTTYRGKEYSMFFYHTGLQLQSSMYKSPATGTMCPVRRTNILISCIVQEEMWHLNLVVTREQEELSGEIRCFTHQKYIIEGLQFMVSLDPVIVDIIHKR